MADHLHLPASAVNAANAEINVMMNQAIDSHFFAPLIEGFVICQDEDVIPVDGEAQSFDDAAAAHAPDPAPDHEGEHHPAEAQAGDHE